MRGAAFQAQVLEVATMYGWLHYHTHDSRHSAAGFPDLVMVRERVLFRELKSDVGSLSVEQREWLRRLREAGADVGVWRPEDTEQIIQELRR